MKLKFDAKLDPGFMPMSIVYRDFVAQATAAGGEKLVIGVERNNGYVSTFETVVFPENSGKDQENIQMIDTIVNKIKAKDIGGIGKELTDRIGTGNYDNNRTKFNIIYKNFFIMNYSN